MTGIFVSVIEFIEPFDVETLLEDIDTLSEQITTQVGDDQEDKKTLLYCLSHLRTAIDHQMPFMFFQLAVSIHTTFSLLKANKQEFALSSELGGRLDLYEDHMYDYLNKLVEKLSKDNEDKKD